MLGKIKQIKELEKSGVLALQVIVSGTNKSKLSLGEVELQQVIDNSDKNEIGEPLESSEK